MHHGFILIKYGIIFKSVVLLDKHELHVQLILQRQLLESLFHVLHAFTTSYFTHRFTIYTLQLLELSPFPLSAEWSAAFPSLMSLPVFSTVRRDPPWTLRTNAPFGDLSVRPVDLIVKAPTWTPFTHIHTHSSTKANRMIQSINPIHAYKGHRKEIYIFHIIIIRLLYWLPMNNAGCTNQSMDNMNIDCVCLYHLIIYIFLCLNLFSNHLFLYLAYISHTLGIISYFNYATCSLACFSHL